MPRELDRELLDDLLDAGNLLCKFGSQLKEWGEATSTAVNRARHAGVAVEIIRMVLLDRGHDDVAVVKTMRDHFNRACRCPKRR